MYCSFLCSFILHFRLFCEYLFNIQMNTIKAHLKCIIVPVYLKLSHVLVKYSGFWVAVLSSRAVDIWNFNRMHSLQLQELRNFRRMPKKVKIRVRLWLMVSQSVSPFWCQVPPGAHYQILVYILNTTAHQSCRNPLRQECRVLMLETGLVVHLIEIGKTGEPVNGRWAWGHLWFRALTRATVVCVVKEHRGICVYINNTTKVVEITN